MQNMLEVIHVTKRYGDQVAVDDVSLSVARGAVHAIVGPNGAGKSTTIRMVLGVLLPDKGSIFVDGAPIEPGHARRIGYLAEARGVYPELTVGRTIDFMTELRRMAPEAAHAAKTMWLERLDLVGHVKKKAGALSKGMQQKLQLLIAVVHDPTLLILDEPFSGLDPLNGELFAAIIREFQARGASVLFSSHNMDQVQRIADSVSIVVGGRVQTHGPIERLLRHTAERSCTVHFADTPQVQAPPGWRVDVRDRVVTVVADTSVSAGNELLDRVSTWGPVVAFDLRQRTLHDVYVEAASPRGLGD